MSKTLYPPILTVGIGSEYRHDDAAGLLIARRMLQLIEPSPDITILQMDGDGAALLEAWEHARSVLLIDTALLVDEPGTILYYDAHEQKLPVDIFSSSIHAFGAMDAVEFTRTMGELPATLIVYGIVGQDFSPGIGLSPKVQQTVDILAPILAEWVQPFTVHPAR